MSSSSNTPSLGAARTQATAQPERAGRTRVGSSLQGATRASRRLRREPEVLVDHRSQPRPALDPPVHGRPPSRLGRLLATVIALAVVVSLPAVSAAAVPKANWYWSLVASHSNPKVLLLGTSNGLYRSADAGTTWRPAGFTGVNATSLAEAGNTIFLGGIHGSPSANPILTTNGNYLVSPGQGLLAASRDDGLTWKQLHPRGLPNLELAALAIDPAHPLTLYAVLRDGSLYRSTDDAGSFRLVSRAIGGTPWALAITQNSDLLGGNMSSGSYLSTDGTAWQHPPFVDSRGTHMVMEFAVDPTDPEHILMTSFGIMSSTDNGKSWHPTLKSKVMFGPVAYTHDATAAYAVGFDGSFWRSGDRGRTWTEVR